MKDMWQDRLPVWRRSDRRMAAEVRNRTSTMFHFLWFRLGTKTRLSGQRNYHAFVGTFIFSALLARSVVKFSTKSTWSEVSSNTYAAILYRMPERDLVRLPRHCVVKGFTNKLWSIDWLYILDQMRYASLHALLPILTHNCLHSRRSVTHVTVFYSSYKIQTPTGDFTLETTTGIWARQPAFNMMTKCYVNCLHPACTL